MSDAPEPNEQQQRLIDETEGIYHVDAGAGTGKTFAVTRRYANIVEQDGVEPDDVLLVTFTNAAATEMRERIVEHSSYGMRDLADAPIQTFHAYCRDLLDEHGYDAPAHLGIDDRITDAVGIVEDELVEHELFREFYGQFRDEHPEYADLYRVLSNPREGLDLINELASKGVFPTADGWYRDSEDTLEGDFERFKQYFDDRNQPRNDGRKQSELRDDLSRFGKKKTYLPNSPSKAELRGGRGTKQLDGGIARDAFESDREELVAFVHDLYFEYLEFALSRDYLNFGFLQLFAFVTLCENPAVRERVSFDYVMVDEFQDTSEIQFKLALLLMDTNNLCVVGDWKQSIYSFQYADVDNIVEFESRLDRFVDELNDGGTGRVVFTETDIEYIQFVQNYRSTQTVLDFSRHALTTPATTSETVADDVLADEEPLKSNADVDSTQIEGIQHADEHEAVLAKIQEIVDDVPDEYLVENGDGDLVAPSYDDIAVLTRTRAYGRELLEIAEEYEFPVAYDGEVELFDSDPAKLLLAWLRIVDSGAEQGWAVVLERAGYTLDEVDAILGRAAYPSNMIAFRDELASRSTVGAMARQVFNRYGLHGTYADELLHLIQSVHDATTMTPGDLIRFIERGIRTGSTHAVDTSTGTDSVTVQTIHAAKGLEYPIVILANMNDGRFPPSTGSSDVLRYEESIGVRQRKCYSEVGTYPHVYDNWRYDVLRRCLPDGYDEERRLLYVALTRAESHLVLAGGSDPSQFLDELPVDVHEVSVDVTPTAPSTSAQTQLPFTVAPPDGPISYSPHELMDTSVFEEAELATAGDSDGEAGRGLDFGSQVHDFAERYALGDPVEPSNDHEERIVSLLDSLDGEVFVEEDAVLPLTVDGEEVAISGIVDLVHVDAETVEIIDYKTDQTRVGESEYRKQLSVYYHVLDAVYPERTVTASIYYTQDGERVAVTPLSESELASLVNSG